MLTEENANWLVSFEHNFGRKPRVLHVGNIANNGYNCAKILNQAGLDNDVICFDYYHIMGCPEWEDADFDGGFGDAFRPKWYDAHVRDFYRPAWFAQGSMMRCIDYLVARRTGRVVAAASLWGQLAIENGSARGSFSVRVKYYLNTVLVALKKVSALLRIVITGRAISGRIAAVTDHAGILSVVRSESIRMLIVWCALTVALLIRVNLRVVPSLLIKLTALVSRLRSSGVNVRAGDDSGSQFNFDREADRLVAEYARSFPARQDKLCRADLEPYRYGAAAWRNLFKNYDYVLCYTTSPVFTLTSGVEPFFAVEHGTLRSVPFASDPQGRCTAIGYRLARHSFITNFDCKESAEKLCGEKFTLINHPYDEDHGIGIGGVAEFRERLLRELDSEFLFFFPTRQDWVVGTGFADKANDVFVRGFATLRKNGIRVGMVCCTWGRNVAESIALIHGLGVDKHVKWIPPQGVVSFERLARASDCVVDQFKLGAFGGVAFKALAVGAPVLTFLDEGGLTAQYDECPPIINCKNEIDVVNAISTLAKSPDGFKVLGEQSRRWIKRFHGKAATVNAIVDQFRQSPVLSINKNGI